MKYINFLIAFMLIMLSACGGSIDVVEDPPPPANYVITIIGPTNDTALVGESIGLVLDAAESNISGISWQQTSGPTISFLAANRKVIGFDVPEVGSYTFSVSFLDSSGGSRSANYSFTATADSPVYINARLDHEANSQAKMSLYAYDNFPGSITQVNWSQISGPTAVLDIANEMAIFFTAPEVSIDTLLQFEVTAMDDQGNSGSDIVNILLEGEIINPNSHFTGGRFENNSLADVYSYRANSSYAEELEECIYSNSTESYCDLEKLPFIGSQNPTPTVSQIMDRVLISHDWMGERFQTFLEQVDQSGDIKNLLGATTSIVISYDIRPSFFWSGTGAIYIDGRYFWVTPEERDTLNGSPDFRSDFDKDLQIRDPWRIVKNNDYAFANPSIESRSIRTIEDSQYFTLRLLYHELAHANDFFPPRAWSSATGGQYPWTYSEANEPDSTGLSTTHALVSDEMYALGDVMFQGVTATQIQINYTPAEVSDFFFPYGATNTYNYSTIREDYAMLAEEYLMGYRHGVLYDQGITGLAPDYIISTAERGRVGHERIKPRAEYVISRILPSIDLQVASASLAAPIVLQSGVSWWDALVAPGAQLNREKSIQKRESQPLLFSKDFHPAESFSH